MAKSISVYGENQVQVGGITPIQTSNTSAQMWEGFATVAERASVGIDAVIEENSRKARARFELDKQVQLQKAVFENAVKYQSDPQGLRTAMESYKEGFLKDITDEEQLSRLNYAFETSTLNALERATFAQQRRIDDEYKASQIAHIDTIRQNAGQYAEDLASNDPTIRDSALVRMSRDMSALNQTYNAVGADGQAMWTPEQQALGSREFLRTALTVGAQARIANAADPVAELEAIKSGGTIMIPEVGAVNILDQRDHPMF
jgi:hypothetical protein